MHDLAELQRRFHALATGESPLEDCPALITSAHARMGVYRRMYRDRLIDVLAGDYPKLGAQLGSAWPELAASYLRACPPAHPDIREAGRRLGDFLDRAGRTWEVDLARLVPGRGEGEPPTARAHVQAATRVDRGSEERRVGKECRSRWSPYH